MQMCGRFKTFAESVNANRHLNRELFAIGNVITRHIKSNIWDRPLSRRLDRSDRVIQDEVGDSNGGNV